MRLKLFLLPSKTPNRPTTGILTQSGLFEISYSTSYMDFSIKQNSRTSSAWAKSSGKLAPPALASAYNDRKDDSIRLVISRKLEASFSPSRQFRTVAAPA